MKIRLKLTLAFLAIAMMVAVVGYFAAAGSQKIMQKTIGDHFTVLAADVLADIDRRIHARIETFQEETRNPYIRQAVSASNKVFENMPDSQAWIREKDSQWVSVPKEEITPFMRDIIDNEVSQYLRENTRYYRDKYGCGVFSEVFVTNKYGVNVAQTGKTTDYYQADEVWWQQTKENGIYVSDVEYDDSSGIYSLVTGLRMEDQRGEFLGEIKVVLNIEETGFFVDKARQSQKHYKTFQLKLMTRDARVIYCTRGGQSQEPLSVALADSLRDKKNVYSVMGHSTACDEGHKAGTTLVAVAHSNGFRDYKGLGWILIAEVQAREIFAPVDQMKVDILILSLAITILSVVLGLFISHTIAHPIQKLTVAASRIDRDHLNITLKVKSKDEVGRLAEAFNTMIQDLKETTSSIDDLNWEISERKKAKNELLKLLSLLEATLDATADGILVIDLDGRIVTHNQKFLKMWHIPPDIVAAGDNEKLLAFVSDQLKDPDAFLSLARRFYSHPENEVFDILEFKDGRVFERFSKSRMIDGKIVGYVRSFRDITDRKKAEDELKKTCAQLEQANKELISTQFQLVQSEKLASIGQLAAGVAHEINNPVGFVSSNFETLENYGSVFLRLISTYDELVKEIQKSAHADWAAKGEAIDKIRNDLKIDFITDDIHCLFEDSREGLDRITKIIQSLRDFSRIDQVSDICEFSFNEGITDTLVVARNEIKYDCDITTDFSDVPPIYCNPGQINQVILNILVNAAQAIKSQDRAESGNIAIKTYKTDESVMCEITDDGPGIPPEIMTKIFDPFFTTKPVGKGTGLGLSISRDIILKHKGQLLVNSVVGKGTTFTIKLPRHFEFSQAEDGFAPGDCKADS
jgi:PAS domain S-box-containing protein